MLDDSLELLHDGQSKELVKVSSDTAGPGSPDGLPQSEHAAVGDLCTDGYIEHVYSPAGVILPQETTMVTRAKGISLTD